MLIVMLVLMVPTTMMAIVTTMMSVTIVTILSVAVHAVLLAVFAMVGDVLAAITLLVAFRLHHLL